MGGLRAAGNFLGERLKRKEEMNSLDSMIKLAQLKESGYDVERAPSVLGGVFGGGYKRIVPSPDAGKVPTGFVRVGGKIVQDPTYMNPKERAMTDYYKSYSGQGTFGNANASIDENGIVAPKPTPEQILNNLNPQEKAFVQGLTNYEVDPNTASKRGNQAMRLVSLAKMVDPAYDMTQYPTRSKYRQEFSSGKVGANIRSFNTAMQHLNELNKEAQGTPSFPIKPIEGATRWAVDTFGGGSKPQLAMQGEQTALTAVAGELANIFKNSGGTDQEIEKWFNAYDPNATKKAKQKFIKTGIELMKGRLGALDADYFRVMGKKYDKSLISPESEQAIQSIMGNGGNIPAWVPKGFESDYLEAKKRGFSDDAILKRVQNMGG